MCVRQIAPNWRKPQPSVFQGTCVPSPQSIRIRCDPQRTRAQESQRPGMGIMPHVPSRQISIIPGPSTCSFRAIPFSTPESPASQTERTMTQEGGRSKELAHRQQHAIIYLLPEHANLAKARVAQGGLMHIEDVLHFAMITPVKAPLAFRKSLGQSRLPGQLLPPVAPCLSASLDDLLLLPLRPKLRQFTKTRLLGRKGEMVSVEKHPSRAQQTGQLLIERKQGLGL